MAVAGAREDGSDFGFHEILPFSRAPVKKRREPPRLLIQSAGN
jgi:hypothetical protein